MKIHLPLLGAALLALTAEPAMAFSYRTCLGTPLKWSSNTTSLRASPVSFPDGYWRNGLQRTVDLTNQNPSRFFFTLTTDSGGVARGNGQNEVWGTSDAGLLDGHPAITFQRLTCYWLFGVVAHYDEADVVFDYRAPFQWTADELKTSTLYYTGTRRQLLSTGIHEFGHALGLLHVNTEYNIMGNDFQHIWANGATARGYLGEDAGDGAAFLYGPWSANFQDLGVSHWKYDAASGEYSSHVKTAIYDSVGTRLPLVAVNGENGYRVRRGQTVQVEFTYENNGKDTQTVNTGWYVSNNDVVSAADRLIALNTGMTLGRDNVLTLRRTLTIPTNLARGRNYWLGTVVDKDFGVPDAVRANNATYIPIRVD